MMKRQFTLFVACGFFVTALACGDKSSNPAAPSSPGGADRRGDSRWLHAESDRADAGVASQRLDARGQQRPAPDQRLHGEVRGRPVRSRIDSRSC